jgi:hypothetical protein
MQATNACELVISRSTITVLLYGNGQKDTQFFNVRLENVGTSTSHNPMGLHVLLQG